MEHLIGAGDATRANALAVTPEIFPMLAVQTAPWPRVHRRRRKVNHGSVAILSHSFFVNRFGGNSRVIGKSIAFNDQSFTIVGVLPPVSI